MKVVIVGGVAGGMSAAARLRRMNEQAEIIVLEKGPYVSFANCGLPYYIGGEIKERSKLIVQTAESLHNRFRIDVRPESEVVRVDRKNRKVVVRHDGTDYDENYDVLILSTGAKPFCPPIDGLDAAKNVFTLRNVPDMDRIMDFIESNAPRTAAVIGAGFIGLEMAENLSRRGLKVSVIERSNQVLPPLDVEMAAFVEEQLKAHGAAFLKEKAVVAFKDQGIRLVLDDGTEQAADLVILSVGIVPESKLASEAGLETGIRGAIIVNDRFQTSDPSIYAIGDVIAVKQVVFGAPAVIPLASPANRQGRLVADVISGVERRYSGALGTSIVRVFDTTAAVTGMNEKQLKAAGVPYKTVHVQPADHAGYYPNSKPLVLKLLFDPKTGNLFGAQAVGANGADKRIDVLATAIKAGLNVYDLTDLELAYAPPYGSAKDPVNILGYAALNVLEGNVESVQWNEVDGAVEAGSLLIDVRNPGELKQGFIRGSVNVPLDKLRDHLDEWPKERNIVVTCQVGLRGYIAARILSQNGFHAKNLDGGFRLYAAALPEKVRHE